MVVKWAQEQALDIRAKTKLEDKTIEQNVRNNTITPDTTPDYSAYLQDKRTPTGIRLPVGFFDSDKIRILSGQKNGSSIVNLYLNLIDIAAKSNRSGALFVADGIPYDAEIIANLTRCDTTTVNNALEALVHYGLIRKQNNVYIVAGYNRLIEFTAPRGRKAK